MGDRLPDARVGGEEVDHATSMLLTTIDCPATRARRSGGDPLQADHQPQAEGLPTRSSVAIEARCWPLSRRQIAEWLVPIRSARSLWVSPSSPRLRITWRAIASKGSMSRRALSRC